MKHAAYLRCFMALETVLAD